jgi:ubiquinol-cytochrome c reductase cytochrome b subunit
MSDHDLKRGLGKAFGVRRSPARPAARWLDTNLGGSGLLRKELRHVFPDSWAFFLGEIALYCFIVLVATGVFLALFFEPSEAPVIYQGSYAPLAGAEVSAAYDSVLGLSLDVPAGLLVRQVHHWAALVFVAALIIHLIRMFVTAAYRRPRRVNWLIGLGLLFLVGFNGLMGYSLADDLLSGTGLRISYAITQSIPFVGPTMASFLFGGEFPGPDIINRLYIIHVLFIPAAIVGLLGIHLGLVVRHKHTQFAGRGRTERNVVGEPVWPRFAFKSIGLMLLTAAVLALLGGLAQINPVWLYGPFEPADVSAASQPDWYMAWMDGALRVFPPWETRAFGFEVPAPFFPAVLLAGVTFGLLYAWPFLEAAFTDDRREHHLLDRPRDRPVRTCMGAATLAFYTILTLAGSTDVLATTFGLSVNAVLVAARVAVLVVPPMVALVTYRLCRELQIRDEEAGMVTPPRPRVRWELLRFWEWPARRQQARLARRTEATA